MHFFNATRVYIQCDQKVNMSVTECLFHYSIFEEKKYLSVPKLTIKSRMFYLKCCK